MIKNFTMIKRETHIMPLNPEISVIIPFYNVETYLDACLSSVLSQDYKGSFEVICVDDGSTDNTGNILNRYSVDARVKVFHKSNGGLSDARNFGVIKASGSFVCFVDGDDFVSPHYLSILVKAQCGHKDRVSMARYLTVKEGRNIKQWSNKNLIRIIDRVEAMRLVSYNIFSESAWAKLYPREICLKNPFPVGRYFEDLSTIGCFLNSVNEIAVTNTSIYAYVQRKNSITHDYRGAEKKVSDYLYALDHYSEEALKVLPADDGALTYRRVLVYMRMRPFLCTLNERGAFYITKHLSYIRNNFLKIVLNSRITIEAKARILLVVSFPKIHDFLLSIRSAR